MRANGLTLRVACDSDDEIRALYRGLFKARNTERSDAQMYRTRLGSGYGTDADRTQMQRADAMYLMLDRLVGAVAEEMGRAGIEPW